MMKRWRREHCPDKRRWPKGITLEKIIADCFPEGSSLYEELMIGVMENIFDSLSEELGDGGVPVVVDPALPTNNLAASYTEEDFRSFVEGLGESLRILQDEGSNNDSWKKVLGNRFPSGSDRAGSRALAKTVFSIQQALSVPTGRVLPGPSPNGGRESSWSSRTSPSRTAIPSESRAAGGRFPRGVRLTTAPSVRRGSSRSRQSGWLSTPARKRMQPGARGVSSRTRT